MKEERTSIALQVNNKTKQRRQFNEIEDGISFPHFRLSKKTILPQ